MSVQKVKLGLLGLASHRLAVRCSVLAHLDLGIASSGSCSIRAPPRSLMRTDTPEASPQSGASDPGAGS